MRVLLWLCIVAGLIFIVWAQEDLLKGTKEKLKKYLLERYEAKLIEIQNEIRWTIHMLDAAEYEGVDNTELEAMLEKHLDLECYLKEKIYSLTHR